jgi:mannose-6-phosphate isomerase-like protein (cupin superfamily)
LTEQLEVTFQGGRSPERDERPWGWFEVLASGAGYQVKRLQVSPLKRLSLQWHRHRDEQWAVARGTARVTVGDRTYNLGRGQLAVVPRTTVHRIENISSVEPLEIIEVQTGDYLGEDDIVRVEDDFGRA